MFMCGASLCMCVGFAVHVHVPYRLLHRMTRAVLGARALLYLYRPASRRHLLFAVCCSNWPKRQQTTAVCVAQTLRNIFPPPRPSSTSSPSSQPPPCPATRPAQPPPSPSLAPPPTPPPRYYYVDGFSCLRAGWPRRHHYCHGKSWTVVYDCHSFAVRVRVGFVIGSASSLWQRSVRHLLVGRSVGYNFLKRR